MTMPTNLIASLFLLLLFITSSLLSITSSSAMITSSARLAGQRVLVTGGGRGIGRAIALICSREGGKVAILVRRICKKYTYDVSYLCFTKNA